jgi:hypothetical protein
MSMSLRHAAALALLGWYLMVPPPNSNESEQPPLSEWSIYKTYESYDACFYFRAEIASGMLQDAPPDFVARFDGSFMDIFKQAQCIASDDPRLKEK